MDGSAFILLHNVAATKSNANIQNVFNITISNYCDTLSLVLLEIISEGNQERNLFEIAPQWARLTLKMLEGYPVYHSRALKRAMEICQKETGECEWPKIPEEYMERGVTEYLEGLDKV